MVKAKAVLATSMTIAVGLLAACKTDVQVPAR